MQNLVIDENPLHGESLWSILKSITYLPLNHFSAAACGLSGSLEKESSQMLVNDESFACNNRYVSAGFQSLTSLHLHGNNISAINGPPWTALLQADLSGNSLISLDSAWYGAGSSSSSSGSDDNFEGAMLTLRVENNPNLRLHIEPPGQACDGKPSENLRADPHAFSAEVGAAYECTVLCYSAGQPHI
eukprot:1316505-Amphidinium_carterae.1